MRRFRASGGSDRAALGPLALVLRGRLPNFFSSSSAKRLAVAASALVAPRLSDVPRAANRS
jgi:hypothetical protein